MAIEIEILIFQITKIGNHLPMQKERKKGK